MIIDVMRRQHDFNLRQLAKNGNYLKLKVSWNLANLLNNSSHSYFQILNKKIFSVQKDKVHVN